MQTVWHSVDVVRMAAASSDGITAKDAARALFDVEVPSQSQIEKARRRLDKLVTGSSLRVVVEGDRSGNRPTRWGAP